MKKILAIGSALLMTVCAFTSCGADRDNSGNDGSYYDSHDYGRDEHTAGEHAKDAVDGAKDAGEDIVGGAGEAAKDIIDGLDGSTEKDSQTNTTTHTTKR